MSDPIRFHHLKAYGRSAAHGKLSRAGAEFVSGPSIEKGGGTHHVLFGTKKVIAYPGAVRRGKEWEDFQARNADAMILTKSDYEKVSRMAEAVANTRLAMEVLGGVHEHTLLFKFMGRDCRATPDARTDGYVTELKTCATSQPERFTWQGLRLAYHAQLAWYQDALDLAGMARPTEAFIVAVESSAPYPVTVMPLTDRALDKGRGLWRSWMERLIGCEESGSWPGYCQALVPFDVPEDDLELSFAGDDETAEAA